MSDDLQQGAGSTETAGVVRSSEELTRTESEAVSVRVRKPGWMRTRFPVSMEEYAELVRRAEWADPDALSTQDDDTLTEDSSTEIAVARTAVVETFDDVPEDAVSTEPAGSAAP